MRSHDKHGNAEGADSGSRHGLPVMVSVCAWCNPGNAAGGANVSHGICLRHLRKMRLDLMRRAKAA